jgi:predicted helicase
MAKDRMKQLSEIRQFPQLVAFLRDQMGWPIDAESDFDDLTYEYTTAELGIDDKSAAQIQRIRRLRPLSPHQPWGVFFVKFEPKKLPVIALRRILSQVALKKRASANPADRSVWAQEDLLFISNYGEGDDRQITLAHFSAPTEGHSLPTLKVLGWDSKDTVLHLEAVARELTEQLSWPADESDVDAWRAKWRAAFTVGHQEVIETSKALSIRLAQLAREIRDRISAALAIENEDGPRKKLMKAFQESLIHDLTPEDFADMFAQTIAYGLLSSRIADPSKKSVDELSSHMRLSPFLQELMETFLRDGGRNKSTGLDFDELGVAEVVDLLDRANMEAVVADFGDKNPQEDPVIHFYELFLKEYDAKKRMSRGVFYTPKPVVSYIVNSIDELLRTEFGLADGLADTATWGEVVERRKDMKIPSGVSAEHDFVKILDPATGTGTFLVETIAVIHKTLMTKWKGQKRSAGEMKALWNAYVPKHLLTRLHGYELLMAPYAIAHLKVGLKLHETGYDFASEQRARVFLTNSLEPGQDFEKGFGFAIPALAHEATAVNGVKQHSRFTVVMGNPPYSNFGRMNKNQFISDLLGDYKSELHERKINLDDDYIKFIRLSQSIIESTGVGVSGMITNNSFLDGITHRQMRKVLASSYQDIRVLNLHGNMLKGEQDENVFDIRIGVGVSFGIRTYDGSRLGSVRYGSTFEEGCATRESKYMYLLATTASVATMKELEVIPPWFWFAPVAASNQEYESFLGLDEIFESFSTGIKTKIDGISVDFEREHLAMRIKEILKEKYSLAEIVSKWGISPATTWEYERAIQAEYREDAIRNYDYRPFDQRAVYYDSQFLSRSRSKVMDEFLDGKNLGLESGRLSFSAFVSRTISDEHFTGGASYKFPLWVTGAGEGTVWGGSLKRQDNFTSTFRSLVNSSFDEASPETIFGYLYAVLYSPAYRAKYAEYFKSGFPRLPLPRSSILLSELAQLGNGLVSLHLLEAPRLKGANHLYVGQPDPVVEKVSWSRDAVWLNKSETNGLKNVSRQVWEFQIGGYQVCDKWLKDRHGRKLSLNDIKHYGEIVASLTETIRFMGRIDEVIDEHGGWLEAFKSDERK